MKPFTKIMQNLKYFMHIGHRISKIYCRGEEAQLGGIGEENKFSGNVHCNKSCLTMRISGNKNLRMIIQVIITIIMQQKVLVSFTDNADLLINRELPS